MSLKIPKVSLVSRADSGADVVFLLSPKEIAALPYGRGASPLQRGQTRLHHLVARREVVAHIGEPNRISPLFVRRLAASAVRELMPTTCNRIFISLGEAARFLPAAVEGAIAGTYAFADFLPQEQSARQRTPEIHFILPKKDHAAATPLLRRAATLAEGTALARYLADMPGNVLPPEKLAREARKLAALPKVTCRLWSPAALKREGFGGIIGVAAGSAATPRLIRLDYRCGKKSAPHVAIVGKAVTFDTGGISIKSSSGMDEMKLDKSGGCAALGILRTCAQLKLPVDVTALVPAVENMPGPGALRPGDIIRAYDGQTIEIIDTDAEGRVILADAIAYAAMRLKPDAIVTLSTLTGAIVAALGDERAGLFTTGEDLRKSFERAADKSGELVWPMPVDENHHRAMESRLASIKNLASSRWGGASCAAAFLQKFRHDVPLVHLDIAGTAMPTEDKSWQPKGATGFGVSLTVEFLTSFKKA